MANRRRFHFTYLLLPFLWAFVVALPLSSLAQGNQQLLDSLEGIVNSDIAEKDKIPAYVTLSNQYTNQDLDRSLNYIEQAIALSKKYQDTANLAMGYLFLGVYELKNRNFQAASDAMILSSQAFEADGNLEGQLSIEVNLGNVYQDQGDFRKAILQYQKCEELSYELDIKKFLPTIYHNTGNLYSNLGMYKNAKEKYHSAYTVLGELEAGHLQAVALGSIANVFYDQHQPDSALYYFERSQELNLKFNFYEGLARDYSGIVGVYLMKGDLEKALQLGEKAYHFSDSLGWDQHKGYAQVYWGAALVLSGQTKEGMNRLHDGLALAREDDISGLIQEAYLNLEKAHAHIGNVDSAYHYLQKASAFDVYADVGLSREDLLELEKDYQSRLQKQETEFVVREKEIRGKLTNYQWILFSVVALSLSLLSIIYIRRYRMKKRLSIQLEEQNTRIVRQNKELSNLSQEKSLLYSELHHRAKNYLQTIYHILKSQEFLLKDTNGKKVINESLEKLKVISNTHEKLVIRKGKIQVDFLPFLKDMLYQLANQYNLKESELSFSTDTKNWFIKADSATWLGLVVNELISNAYKHARREEEELKIDLELKREDDEMLLAVSDNGDGFEPGKDLRESATGLSNGLELVSALIHKVQGKVDFVNQHGTRAEIRVPHRS